MIITNKSTISFRLSDEYNIAYQFKEQHPDWRECVSSNYIGYTKEVTYSVEMREDGAANADVES